MKADSAALDFGRKPVLEAVFDNRLKQHAGNKGFQRFRVNFLDDFEIVLAEAGNLDIQIIVDKLQLLLEGDECFVFAQDAAKNVAEFEHDAARGIRVEADERRNSV